MWSQRLRTDDPSCLRRPAQRTYRGLGVLREAHPSVRRSPRIARRLEERVDDLRLRLWGVLSTGSADDYGAFQERFRLRRAAEICEDIESELSTGLMNPRHEELRRLGEGAGALARRIQELAG
jgi:hypothetical protein